MAAPWPTPWTDFDDAVVVNVVDRFPTLRGVVTRDIIERALTPLPSRRWRVHIDGLTSREEGDWPPGKSADKDGWSPAQVYFGVHPTVTCFPYGRGHQFIVFQDSKTHFQRVFPLDERNHHPHHYAISQKTVRSMLKEAEYENRNFRILRSHPWSTLKNKDGFAVTAAPHRSETDPWFHITIMPFDADLLKKAGGQIHLRLYICNGCGQAKEHFKWDSCFIHLMEYTLKKWHAYKEEGRLLVTAGDKSVTTQRQPARVYASRSRIRSSKATTFSNAWCHSLY